MLAQLRIQGLMDKALFLQIQSFLVMSLLYVGVYLRKKRSVHIRIQSTAIVWDILLILQIEMARGAILKASKAMTNAMLLNIHVAIAVSTVLLYFTMIYTGRQFLKGNNPIRFKHKVLGWTTLTMRTLTFITSFWAA